MGPQLFDALWEVGERLDRAAHLLLFPIDLELIHRKGSSGFGLPTGVGPRRAAQLDAVDFLAVDQQLGIDIPLFRKEILDKMPTFFIFTQ